MMYRQALRRRQKGRSLIVGASAALFVAISGAIAPAAIDPGPPVLGLDPLDCEGTDMVHTVNQSGLPIDNYHAGVVLFQHDKQLNEEGYEGVKIFNQQNIEDAQLKLEGFPEVLRMNAVNQIAVSKEGKRLYFTSTWYRQPNPADPTKKIPPPTGIIEYDLQSNTFTTFFGNTNADGTRTPVNSGVAGATNLLNDFYYHGNYSVQEGTGLVQMKLGVLKPASVTGASEPEYINDALTIVLKPDDDEEALTTPSNGDIAFARNGDLFLIHTSSKPVSEATPDVKPYSIWRVEGPIPEQSDTPLVAERFVANTVTGVLNGIAVGEDSRLYASGTKEFKVFNPTTLKEEDSGTIAGTDLGSCVGPSTVTLLKNVEGRNVPTDQFQLELSETGSTEEPAKETTKTDTIGLQPEKVFAIVNREGSFTIAESPAGTTDLSAYSKSYSCEDRSVDPVDVFAQGVLSEDASQSIDMPGRVAADVFCTITNSVGEPFVNVSKSANPDSGTLRAEGETVEYTLAFSNGNVTAPIDWTDDISGVLDDATIVPGSEPTVSVVEGSAEVSVGELADGKFSVTGTMFPNAVVNVTYTVKVDPPEDGDRYMVNWLYKTTVGKPDAKRCPDSPPEFVYCTEHPVPNTKVDKIAEPPSGTEVSDQQKIDYTLKFTNDGAAPAEVDYVDNISGVLDDGALTEGPTVVPSGGALSVSDVTDGKFTVKGTLAPFTSETVTYTVQVDGSLSGDYELLNFLYPTGTETVPETCTDNLPVGVYCTVHPYTQTRVTKTAVPPSGTVLELGQSVEYTVKLENLGATAAKFDETDYLTDVIDDAQVTVAPVVTPGASGITVDPVDLATINSTGKFVMSGELEPASSAEIKYTVKVNDTVTGNKILDNFVVQTGTTPKPPCKEPDPRCTQHLVGTGTVVKSALPPSFSTVVPGQEVEYVLTFTSTGEGDWNVDYTDDIGGVLDDADFVEGGEPKSDNDNLTVDNSTLASGDVFSVSGYLPKGEVAKVTYKVKVFDDIEEPLNDYLLENFVYKTGDKPEKKCIEGEDELCTIHPVTDGDVFKSSVPVPGTVLKAGDEVVYTLTFRNQNGKAPWPVDYLDDVENILDDADIIEQPVSSDPDELTVKQAGDNENRYEIKGAVPAGEIITVTYKAKVKDPLEGDNLMENFLFRSDEKPPPKCLLDNPLCTWHPIAQLEVSKTADPESGSTVPLASKIAYKITFSNEKGQGPAAVDYYDDISKVLDDGKVTKQPSSSSEDLSVTEIGSDGRFTIEGMIPPGEQITVEYEVTVNTSVTGNKILDNFVVKTREEPPPECLAENQLCTRHLVDEPTTPTTAPPTTAPPTTAPPDRPRQTVPKAGWNAQSGGQVGLLLALAGGCLVVVSRRRRRALL